MTAVLWTLAVSVALIVTVLLSILIPAIREELYERAMRRQAAAPIHIAPSPLVPTTLLATRKAGHHARLDQQARHAAVVTATGMTQQFNRIVEANTGQPPAGRGPAEADLPTRRVRRERPLAEWSQLDLFAEATP